MATSSKDTEQVTLPTPDIQHLAIRVKGLSPLICHNWDEKSKKMMLDKQTKKASAGREAKDPDADYRGSLYPLPQGGYGFPASAFKKAAVRAGTYTDDKMTFLRGAFYVQGDLVEIVGEPRPREDMVRVGMGTADIRYRAEFPDWSATLRVQFNARAISAEQVVNLFAVAGFSVGVGDWRPEKDGSYGRFEVVS